MFSVGTDEEAERLLTLCCPKSVNGEYLARELTAEQSLENLEAFSKRLEEGHNRLVDGGQCDCQEL